MLFLVVVLTVCFVAFPNGVYQQEQASLHGGYCYHLLIRVLGDDSLVCVFQVFAATLALHGRHIEDSPDTRVASLGDSGLALDRARLVVLDIKPCIAGELVSALYQRKAVGLGNDSHGRQEADGRDGMMFSTFLASTASEATFFFMFSRFFSIRLSSASTIAS